MNYFYTQYIVNVFSRESIIYSYMHVEVKVMSYFYFHFSGWQVYVELLLGCGVHRVQCTTSVTHIQIYCQPQHSHPPPPSSVGQLLLTASWDEYSIRSGLYLPLCSTIPPTILPDLRYLKRDRVTRFFASAFFMNYLPSSPCHRPFNIWVHRITRMILTVSNTTLQESLPTMPRSAQNLFLLDVCLFTVKVGKKKDTLLDIRRVERYKNEN